MSYTFEQRVGSGCTLGWDSTGGSSYVVLGTVVDGDKFEAKFKTANISLLSDVAEKFSKTSYDPGSFKFTIVYDPLASEYLALKASFITINAPHPKWQLSFPDTTGGAGSGAATEIFTGPIIGLGREVKKDAFLMVDVEVKLSGAI